MPLPPYSPNASACAKLWNPCYPCGPYNQSALVPGPPPPVQAVCPNLVNPSLYPVLRLCPLENGEMILEKYFGCDDAYNADAKTEAYTDMMWYVGVFVLLLYGVLKWAWFSRPERAKMKFRVSTLIPNRLPTAGDLRTWANIF